MNTTTETGYETFEVLAGCYKGGRKGEMLTHYGDPSNTENAICGRVQDGGLCDRVVAGPATCPVCVRKAAKATK